MKYLTSLPETVKTGKGTVKVHKLLAPHSRNSISHQGNKKPAEGGQST